MDKLLNSINQYENLIRIAFIKKVKNKYQVVSRKGKNLGIYNSKSEAEKRLKQIEFFKHDENHLEDKINLTDAEEFSYSSIMRQLNKKCKKSQVTYFLKLFKIKFDRAVKEDLQKPEKIALQESLIEFNEKYPIKLSKKITKNAAVSELGNINLVGKYLSDIIKFILSRVDSSKRNDYLLKVKSKLNGFDENDLATKEMPMSAAIGQAITFVKHVLFNQDAKYIRSVLNEVISNL